MKKPKGKGFWNAEYNKAGHLALSMNPSEDLERFIRWLEREQGRALLNITSSILDLGCGNGRNIIWLAGLYGVRGIGFDVSKEAIAQAKKHSIEKNLPLTYEVRSIAGVLPVPDASQAVVLDMMTSHFLKESERALLIQEVYRVLRPGGFLFYKTFLLDEDQHAKRMLEEHPAAEAHTYIHPEIGVAEHVSTQEEIERTYGEYFTIHIIHKSHRHKGKDGKRRSISVYMQKEAY